MQKKKEKRIGKKMVLDSVAILCLSGVLGWLNLYSQIPDELTIALDADQSQLLGNIVPDWLEEAVKADSQTASNIPLQNLKLTGEAAKDSEYEVTCSLFGTIPLKTVEVNVVEREKVIPCGMPVGIYMKTQGVLIVGTGEVCDINGQPQNPGGELVHSGDYILAVNDIPVSEKEEVMEQINHAAGGSVKLTVLRDQDIIELQAPVVQTGESEYKAGIWIRDDTQGIGTLTYVTDEGTFGALGHGINDIDTSTLLTLEEGNIYETEIRSIVRGMDGLPGEVGGTIDYQEEHILGNITENTEIGIFGILKENTENLSESKKETEVAYKQEITCGKAVILSEITGEAREYEIEIEKVNLNNNDVNKSMVIKVTDPELLELTGGIVRGMSGSPILQNGRLIGAVTHVFVKDPTRGYGIFIENMLK